MSNRRPYLLIGATVFMVGVAMRTIPLYWSPLPFNLDGFHFAVLAQETIVHGHLPISQNYFYPDEYTFTALLTIVSQMTDISPLYVAQILIANIGATLCLFVVVITRRVGHQLRWSDPNIRTAALVAGLVLATEGIFLGRSTAVSSEGVGHLFVIMSVFVFAHTLWTTRFSWVLLTGLIFLMFPLTHNLSTIVGAFSIVSLLTLFFKESVDRITLTAAILIVGFWVYTGIYYTISEFGALGRISAFPGLFIAWIIILVLLTLWLPTTQPRFQRGIPMTILSGSAGLLVVNYSIPIFPGTATTDPLTLLFILPIALLGIIAFWGIPSLTEKSADGYAVFAVLIGSLSFIGFALTARLTVEYQALAIRSHIFVHIAFAILVGLGMIALNSSKHFNNHRTAFVVFIVVCSTVSAPLAFSGLHATSAQPLVTQEEFETVTFAVKYTHQWTSDGHMTRLASRYYPTQTSKNITQMGIYRWLRRDGSPPSCPIITQRSWTTVGAQLFPSSPEEINPGSYENIIYSRNKVYTTSGEDPLIFSIPSNGEKLICR